MTILLIEYRVTDVAEWTAVFDQDPMGRKAAWVSHHWIYQDCDDPNHLMLSLEFPSAEKAKTFCNVLQPVWDMSGAGQAWVLQESETATYRYRRPASDALIRWPSRRPTNH
jgi:hypothetical protein